MDIEWKTQLASNRGATEGWVSGTLGGRTKTIFYRGKDTFDVAIHNCKLVVEEEFYNEAND